MTGLLHHSRSMEDEQKVKKATNGIQLCDVTFHIVVTWCEVSYKVETNMRRPFRLQFRLLALRVKQGIFVVVTCDVTSHLVYSGNSFEVVSKCVTAILSETYFRNDAPFQKIDFQIVFFFIPFSN